MPRIQILELPTEHHGDDMTTPYLLIIDQVPSGEATFDALRNDLHELDLAARTGARAVLAFEGTIDIPANSVMPSDDHAVHVPLEGDPTEARAQVEQALRTAQARLATGTPR